MSRASAIVWLVVAFVVGVLLANTFFIVDQRQQAVVVQPRRAGAGDQSARRLRSRA